MNSNVLLLTSIYPPEIGGPAVFTARFSDWLSNKGIKCKVVTYSTAKVKYDPNIISVKVNRFRLWAFFNFIFKIIVNQNKNTLILANGVFIETYFACLLTRKEYVTKIPGDQVWEYSRNKRWTNNSIEHFQIEKLNVRQFILRKMINLSLKNSKSLIAPSNQLAHIPLSWGLSKDKIEIIYNSADSTTFMNSINTLKLFDLVTVCRLVPWKGLEELVCCANQLNLSLAIIGDGPLMPELKLINDRNQGKVTFFGAMDNSQIVETLNISKLFVLNSEFEATSYALIEAKMCGLPVVARENNGSKTLVRNKVDGLLYSQSKGNTLQEAISKILNNKQMAADFGQRAREDALKRFNQDINFKKIFDKL